MEKLKEVFKNLYENATDLYNNNRRVFCQIATKASFTLLYLIAIMFPFYSGKVYGITVNVSVFIFDITWVYIIVFLALPLLYLFYAIQKKVDLANKTFKLLSILVIISFLRFILSLIGDSSESLVTVSIKFGFFLQIIMVAIVTLLAFKESLVMSFIYKVFKVPESIELEVTPEPVEEPNVEEPKLDPEPEEPTQKEE